VSGGIVTFAAPTDKISTDSSGGDRIEAQIPERQWWTWDRNEKREAGEGNPARWMRAVYKYTRL